MKKFVKRVLVLAIVVVAFVASIVAFDCFCIGSQYQAGYQASLVDKVNRLEAINEPKIILVGNSNLSFGIDSKMLEDSFGMPVVNLGLHGGLGNAFHEEIAKLNINEGDIVIVCHNSFSDNDTISDAKLAWITYDWNEVIWPIIREKDYLSMLRAYPAYFKSALLLWIHGEGNKSGDSAYSRNAFNEYGDVEYKPEKGQMDVDKFFSETPITVPSINDTCINRLNEFNEFCTDRGATMLVAGYPIAYGKYADFDKADFDDFQHELSERLDCEVISDYSDYFFSYDCFYDTFVHLTTDGACIRTQQLIDDLKMWIEDQS